MNEKEQQIAIAKACGVKVRKIRYNRGTPAVTTTWISESREPIPDYLNDLNAMHEAEKVLCDMENWEMCIYENRLNTMTTNWPWHAAAPQRAEAFLKSLDLWEESN
tara:strand:+ start:12758 stop:13075 length:318 start_codon:yes stop_codon:yes gene_type:complete